MSAFRSWNGVELFSLYPGVTLHAIGGDQALICRVQYEPGTTVPRHSHASTEQVMLITDGSLVMTIGDEMKEMVAGDVAVVNRGIEHELFSEHGCSFIEALAPPPLDHVPDRERDLVLGDLAGSLHVDT